MTVERKLVGERKGSTARRDTTSAMDAARRRGSIPARGGLDFAVGEIGMTKGKQTDSQRDLPFSRSPDVSRTLEIHCGNCGAKFIAFYGTRGRSWHRDCRDGEVRPLRR